MRLWHKAWCETRARFVLAVVGLVAAALVAAVGGQPLFHAAFGESTSTLFVLLVVLLGGGTLRQERALGTVGFTLALPVTRARLFAARAGVGAAQVVALACLPALLVVAGGAPGPVGPLTAGWIACGLALFAAALLVATLVTQELVAWLVTYTLFFAYEGLVNVTGLREIPALDLYRLMSVSRMTGVPWIRVAVVLAVAAALLLVAARSEARASRDRGEREPGPGRARSLGATGPVAALLGKAWREARARFWVAALVLGGLTLTLTLFHEHFRGLMGARTGPASTYAGYLSLRLHAGVGKAIFTMLVVLLGLGGLQRESVLGTLGFSLALPVGRGQHVAARAAVGLAQVTLLACLPALLVPVASLAIGQHYPFAQALAFALLWSVGGALFFAVAFVVSTLVRSDVAAFALALVVVRLGAELVAPFLGDILVPPGALQVRGDQVLVDLPAARLLATCAVTAVALLAASRTRGHAPP